MTLEEKVAKDLVVAMKAKDQGAVRALRAIKAEILLFNTSGSHMLLDAAQEVKILQKMVKQRRDSLQIYEEQSRQDLAEIESDEIAVISRYLPKQMDTEELTAFLTDLVKEVGASGMKDMGRVMGAAQQRLSGRADGKAIADIVKQILMT
jgi:uncharacterized protein YqeY